MAKWYNKSIEVITKRNVITVLLFILSFFFYAIQKISDNEAAKIIGIFSFSTAIGQYIGERISLKRKKNILIFYLLSISIIFLIFGNSLKNGEIISTILLGITAGEGMGFHVGRMRAKKQIS